MLDFRKPASTVGTTATKPAAANVDRPKAEFWLNIGYTVEEQTEDGVVDTFISLPMGIPLDDQKTLPVNSSNERFAAISMARNDLYEQLMQACAQLEPGQEQIVKLEVQVRRVRGDAPTVSAKDNPFMRKLIG